MATKAKATGQATNTDAFDHDELLHSHDWT